MVDEFFRESPFALTASCETAACWSGRVETQERLTRLQASFHHRSDSSLDVLWANFGAGKSHTLYYLAHRLTADSDGNGKKKALVAFVEMPEQLRRFVDLYSRIIRALPIGEIARLVSVADAAETPEDLRRCATAFLHGGPGEQSLAREWISGGHLGLRELKSATGIRSRIEDDVSACDSLSGIVGAAARAGVRIVILLDEFQRIAAAGPHSRRDAILSNIRSVFSRNARGFSMVVAVTSRMEQSALAMFPRELRSLLGARPAVSLPVLSVDEAVDFILGRFRFFRREGYAGPDAAPFGRQTLEAVIRHIAAGDATRLIPRKLLQAFAWIYDAEGGMKTEIEASKAIKALEELRWEAPEAEQ